MSLSIYSKPPKTISEQVKLLQDRGMLIPNTERAKEILSFVGFYRFFGYALPFTVKNLKPYRLEADTYFDDVWARIRFDGELKSLVLEQLAKIEVAIRTVIANESSVHYVDPHWYMRRATFKSNAIQDHANFVSTIIKDFTKSKEAYCQHYKHRYDLPHTPPIWVVTEIVTMGFWSKFYSAMSLIPLKKKISSQFNIDPEGLESDLHHLTHIRNVCAHHGTLYNRKIVIIPSLKRGKNARIPLNDNSYFAACCGVIWFYLKQIDKQSDFILRLQRLIKNFGVDSQLLGFPISWESDAYWK
jgi:abortive infection bacteriophage resistance protein